MSESRIRDSYAFNARQYDTSLLKAAGTDVFISALVEIRRPQLVSIGSHIAIDTGFYATCALELGNYIHIGPYVCVIGGARTSLKMGHFTNIALGGRLICGSDLFAGEGLIFAPGIPEEYMRFKLAPIILEDFATICGSVTILPGVRIAEGSVVGAGSLVVKDTEPWTIYAGSPAKAVRRRPSKHMLEYAKKLGYPFA